MGGVPSGEGCLEGDGGGQILICVGGRGYYQEWEKEAVEMKPGDCINIPAGVKHWHGAAPDSWFSHLAIEVLGENGSNEWLEPVDEKQYGRLMFAAVLPLPCVDGAIEETTYAIDTLGAVGVKVVTNSNGRYLGDPSFDPLMEELNRRNALVIIHPCRARQRPENVITGKVAALYEYPADTTRAVLNMIAHRIMTRFPNIRFVVPHTGSFLPYMLQRFMGVSGILASMGMMETVDAKEEFKRLYFDIAGDPEPVALDMLRMVADDNHIVYGSDFPHSPAKVIIAKKKHFENNVKYQELLQQIYQKNALPLLSYSILTK